MCSRRALRGTLMHVLPIVHNPAILSQSLYQYIHIYIYINEYIYIYIYIYKVYINDIIYFLYTLFYIYKSQMCVCHTSIRYRT